MRTRTRDDETPRVVVDDIKFPATMLPVYEQNRKGIDPAKRAPRMTDIGSQKRCRLTGARRDCCSRSNTRRGHGVIKITDSPDYFRLLLIALKSREFFFFLIFVQDRFRSARLCALSSSNGRKTRIQPIIMI